MSTEFIEELDALQSVYSNLTIRTVSRNGPEVSIAENLPLSCDNICMFVKEGIQSGSSASNQDYHAIIQLSCSPQYNSASFVSTDIQISIPSLYPSIRPVFEILKSSGLCDEGREMKEIVHRFIEDSQPEECLLFQLISVVHDFLDSCSIGECSICAEEIAEFIYQGDSLTEDVMQSMEGACFGLKTPCSHCFHVKCLTHWAAISIVQKENKKSTASWITDRNQNSIKTLHGQLKSSESDVTSLLEQQEKCDIEIAETKKELIRALEYEQDKNAILNDKNSLKKERNKTKSASKTIEKKKKNDEILMKEIGTPSGPGSGSGSVVNDVNLKGVLAKSPSLSLCVNEAIAEEGKIALVDCPDAPKTVEKLLEKLQIESKNISDKLKRVEKRLEGYRLELTSLEDIQDNKEKEKSANRSFPCGYCRTVLSSTSCVVSENKHLKTLFNFQLSEAIQREIDATRNISKS